VSAGHAARLRYDEQLQWWEITDVVVGSPSWQGDLVDAGRRGGVVQRLPRRA
jgi:prephenate dehydrogenase